MARPKRASMREGPLAGLFRSTTPPEDEDQPTTQQPAVEEVSQFGQLGCNVGLVAAVRAVGADDGARSRQLHFQLTRIDRGAKKDQLSSLIL